MRQLPHILDPPWHPQWKSRHSRQLLNEIVPYPGYVMLRHGWCHFKAILQIPVPLSLPSTVYLIKPLFSYQFNRCLWPIGRCPYRVSSREIPVCPGGILSYTISQSTDEIWQAVTSTTISTHRLQSSDWTTVLCKVGREDSNWKPHPRHVTQR